MRAKERGPSSRLPREVWVLAGVGFLVAIGFGVMSPVLPVYARTFGVTSFMIGLVVSGMSILRASTMPLSSQLLRWIGPRELAIVGNALIAVTTFMIGIAKTYWGVLLWRALSGFGSALYGVSSMALLFAAVPSHLRGRANALSGGGWVLGAMAGPALGGFIAAISIHAPFFFYSATLACSSVFMVILLPRAPIQQRRAARTNAVRLMDLARDRRFRAAIVMNFANGWQSNGVRALLIPLFIVEILHRDTVATGLAFAIAAIAQASFLPLTGMGTDRLGRRFMMLAGGGLACTVSVGLALAQSYVVLIILMCLYAIGASAAGSASQAMLADTVPVSASAGLAAFQMAGDIGQISGPLVAGAILDAISMPWAWLVGAVILATAVVLTWGTPKGIQPPVGSTASL